MSSSIYIFQTNIFPYNKEAPFQYLLHTLFLQNIEKIILLGEDLSDFFKYVNFLLISQEKSEEFEKYKGIIENFANNSANINKILKKFENFTDIKEFYEFINKFSLQKNFIIVFETIIQTILLSLALGLKKLKNSQKLSDSEQFESALEAIKKNKFNNEEILIFIFLNFLKRNCKILSENDQNSSSCYVIDKKLDFLILFLDEENKMWFLQLDQVNSFYKKKNIKNSKDLLDFGIEKTKIENKPKKDEKKCEDIYQQFILNLFEKILNIPDGNLNEEEVKQKINEKIDAFEKIQGQKLNIKDLDKLERKLKKFRKEIADTKIKTKEKLVKFQENWKENN